MRQRNLPVDYIRDESNGLEYFKIKNKSEFQDTYLFPDFERIKYSTQKNIWEVEYDDANGITKASLETAHKNLLMKYAVSIAKEQEVHHKIIVERNMIQELDLEDIEIPDYIFITWSYEEAFANEDACQNMKIPSTIIELFQMMNKNPNISGSFCISEDGGCIEWDLFESNKVRIYREEEWIIDVDTLIHWHPTIYEIWDEIRKLGNKENVLVVRTLLNGAILSYQGSKIDCSYNKGEKTKFGKLHYLEVK